MAGLQSAEVSLINNREHPFTIFHTTCRLKTVPLDMCSAWCICFFVSDLGFSGSGSCAVLSLFTLPTRPRGRQTALNPDPFAATGGNNEGITDGLRIGGLPEAGGGEDDDRLEFRRAWQIAGWRSLEVNYKFVLVVWLEAKFSMPRHSMRVPYMPTLTSKTTPM